MDLIYRKTLKCFYKMFYFSEELDIQNLILRPEHIERGYGILRDQIKSSGYTQQSFTYENQEEK